MAECYNRSDNIPHRKENKMIEANVRSIAIKEKEWSDKLEEIIRYHTEVSNITKLREREEEWCIVEFANLTSMSDVNSIINRDSTT